MNQYFINEFIAGGYYLTKYTNRSEYMSSDLLPPQIVSASACIVGIVPNYWAVEWASYEESERKKKASQIGIMPDMLPQVIRWITSRLDSHEIGWGGGFNSVDLARQFAQQFLPNSIEIILIGIGLHRELVNTFLKEEGPLGIQGTYEALSQGKSLELGGEVMGFEVLGYEGGGFHSWLCNSLEVHGYREFKIRPNSYGFIDTLEEAAKCAEYASREEVGAEPALWQPWVIVQYPVKI